MRDGVRQDALTHQAYKSRIRADEPTRKDHGVESRLNVIAACLVGLCLVTASTPSRARAQESAMPSSVSPEPGPTSERPAQLPRGSRRECPWVTSARAPARRRDRWPLDHARRSWPDTPPALDPNVQVVRFHGPTGLTVEVLAPQPSPAPIGDGSGIATVGLKRGVGYRLRLSNITERPGVELFPVIEIVGHLHRPSEIDPAKYPIRVVFTDEELWDVVDHGRLVTKVIYLEDPEQALPLNLPKDQIPVVTLSPTEQPLKVAEALGRAMAIVRIGVRRPTVEEINAGAAGDAGLDAMPRSVPAAARSPARRCPLSASLRAGLRRPSAAEPPMLPRDEYLCDGGDEGSRRVSVREAASRESIRVTRSSTSTSAWAIGASIACCPPTSSASTHPGSPRFASARARTRQSRCTEHR